MAGLHPGRTRMSLAIVAILGLLGLIFAPAAVAHGSASVFTGGLRRVDERLATSVFRLGVAGGSTLRLLRRPRRPRSTQAVHLRDPAGGKVPNSSQVLWDPPEQHPVAHAGPGSRPPAAQILRAQAALWHYTGSRTLDTNKAAMA